MWMFNVFFIVLTAFATLSLQTFKHERDMRAQGYAAAVSSNFSVYGNLTAAYAHANQGFSGSVSNATLNLPAWFNPWAGISNYVQAGTSYVYLLPSNTAAGQAMAASLANQKAASGINRNGTLYNAAGAIVQALPAAVPNGAVVLVIP